MSTDLPNEPVAWIDGKPVPPEAVPHAVTEHVLREVRDEVKGLAAVVGAEAVPITSFAGDHRFLSNFWPARVSLDGLVYPTVEHAYVAAKTLDLGQRKAIRATATPGQVKRLGRKLDLRHDWNDVRVDVMANLVAQKFADPKLREMLLATGSAELVEGNAWGDTFWGVCRGIGENHLGRILMNVRANARRCAS